LAIFPNLWVPDIRFTSCDLRILMGHPTDAISWHDPPSRQDDRWFGGPDRYANNQVECDHGRLKARLRPMRGLKQDRSAEVIIAGHALVQNLRRGHYELAVEVPANRRLAVAFSELAVAISPRAEVVASACPWIDRTHNAAAGAAWRWRGRTSVASSWR
jgi:hypothetical protein